MDKYFLYARKSTDDKDRQVQSIPNQIELMKKRAKEQGIEIIGVYQESMSAKGPGRPIFNEMINRINKGEANGIIAWKVDRLTRNPIDTGTLQFMLQNGKLNKIITNERDYDESNSGLMFSVESGMGNQFILDLRKAVKRGMDYKTSTGVFCGMVPEGYINAKEDNTIDIDVDRFDLVRKMWDLMLIGNYTIPQIVDIANNDWGFIGRKRGKKNGLKPISESGLRKMFKNVFYTGDFLWKGEIKRGTHKAMVTYEEFNRVQKILGEKGLDIRGKTREFAFTGFMKCGECGSAITAIEKNKIIKTTGEEKTYIYYSCTKRKKGCEKCSQKPIRLEELEEQINDLILNIEIIPQFKEWSLEVLEEEFKNDIKEKELIQKTLQDSLNREERKLSNLTQALINELIDEKEYSVSKKQIKLDIEMYRKKLEKLGNDKDESIDDTEKVFNFIIQARSSFNYGNLQTKREIFRSLGLNWILKDGKLEGIAYPWFKPIEKFIRNNNINNTSLELIKKSISSDKTNTQNTLFANWSGGRGLNSHTQGLKP